MNRDRLRRAIGVAILILGCAISAKFLVMALTATTNTSDFTVLWAAGRADPALVYDHVSITAAQRPITGLSGDQVRPFVYPPSSLLLFRPLAAMPFRAAYLVWIGALLLAFAAAALVTHRRLPVIAALATPPLVYGIWAGQPSILAAAILIAAIPLLGKRSVLAGIAMGVGGAIKPQAFILVPLALLLVRDWRALVGFLLGGALPVCVSAVLWPELWPQWIDAVRTFPSIVSSLGLDRSGVSPAAIAPDFGLPSGIGTAIQLLAIILGLWWIWTTWRRTTAPARRTTALIGGAILVSPYAMPYELAGLMPAAVAALLQGRLALGLTIIPPFAKFTIPVVAMLASRRHCGIA